ncbi:class I SAM-dependent methyltransferase, partial [Hazenella sp. IB182357]|nr:class I SAM-dependent methyltransferase [Polycladospora coralii]
MPNHKHVYKNEVLQYDRMISKQPNLLPHIEKIVAVEGLDIIDIGAGTGRLTIPLAQTAKSVLALDQSPEMLSLIATRLDQLG